jgi:hypothetical protein
MSVEMAGSISVEMLVTGYVKMAGSLFRWPGAFWSKLTAAGPKLLN